MTATGQEIKDPKSPGFETHWRDFILANTRPVNPPHVPEISLALATDECPVWNMSESDLENVGLRSPYWAFAWAGGQALARYVLDNPAYVADETVLDIATGSGIVAIAAAMAGARKVTGNDIDPICKVSLAINSEYNDVDIGFCNELLIGKPDAATGVNRICSDPLSDASVILAGDVFYDVDMATDMLRHFKERRAAGVRVLVGDPVRSYFPRAEFRKLMTYEVSEVGPPEDQDVRRTHVWELA